MKLFHKLNGKWSEVTSSNEGSSSDINLPEGGSDGYLLSKLGDNLTWTNPKDVGTKLPEDGLSGQVLSLDNSKNLKWSNSTTAFKLNVGDLIYTFNNTPPANTFLCDNSFLNKEEYPELYSVIGDKFLVNDDSKLMVPMYDVSTQASKLSNSTSDLTLGSESYYSVDLDNRIRIKSIGNKGGLYSTQYPAYYAFNTGLSGEYYFHSNTSEPGIIEIEYLDGTKFAPYKYDLHIYVNNVWFTQWDLTGWNEETSTWDILDYHDDGTLSNPPKGVETSIIVANYDNTKCYSKFRMSFRNMNGGNLRLALWTLKLYGTKEGEASIYDGFALPPSSTNESGARACIVYTSGETQIQESWTDISSLVPTNSSNYDFIAEYDGYIWISKNDGSSNNGGVYYNNRAYAWIPQLTNTFSYIVPIFKGETYQLLKQNSSIKFQVRYWIPKK